MIVLVKHEVNAQDCWECGYFQNDNKSPFCNLHKIRLRNKRINKTEHAFKFVRSRKCWHAQWLAEKTRKGK